MQPEPTKDLRSDPGYSEGFWAARDGDPLFPDASEAYAAGWHACHRCKEILERAGFTRTGDTYSKTTVITPISEAPDEPR